MAPDADARVFFWYFACERGCSRYVECQGRVLPADWETWRCAYCNSPLRAFYPKDVTAEPPG